MAEPAMPFAFALCDALIQNIVEDDHNSALVRWRYSRVTPSDGVFFLNSCDLEEIFYLQFMALCIYSIGHGFLASVCWWVLLNHLFTRS